MICHSNQLNNADVRNGNNFNSNWYTFSDNPQLFCINVDDPVYSNATWTVNTGMIESVKFMRGKGVGIKKIASDLSIGVGTVYKVLENVA